MNYNNQLLTSQKRSAAARGQCQKPSGHAGVSTMSALIVSIALLLILLRSLV